MSTPSRISKIKKITGGGVLDNYSHRPDLPEFSDRALIYGFNGSGKSTISRIVASIGKDHISPLLPAGCAFTLEFSDGTQVRSSEVNEIANRVAVFNEDFVVENLNWSAGSASPVFYVGKEQAKNADKFSTATQELGQKIAERKLVDQDKSQKCRAFEQLKTNAARNITNELGLGRSYNAPDFAKDCENHNYDSSSILSNEQVDAFRDLLTSTAPQPKLLPPQLSVPQLAVLEEQVRSLLEVPMSDSVAGNLMGHESMFSWVRAGYDYHKQHRLEDCLLCSNKISNERLAILQNVLEGGIREFLANIDAQLDSVATTVETLDSNFKALPHVNEISPDLRSQYFRSYEALDAFTTQTNQSLLGVRESLERKRAKPQSELSLSGGILESKDSLSWEATYSKLLDQVLNHIESHNLRFEHFEQEKDNAKSKYKSHLIQGYIEEYSSLKDQCSEATETSEEFRLSVEEITERTRNLEESLREHSIAADEINRAINAYLGHNELQFRSLDKGYEITRRGQLLSGPLSEGERTAIALCYFIATLKADGREHKNLIIVLDDPISSLDTRALNYSAAMIKSACDGCCQIILLTHNLHFMNQAKRWVRKDIADKDKLYLLKITTDPNDGLRHARLERMPKYIREYESEYHYLYFLVKEFVESEGNDNQFLYVLPNALRKILDIFLAFKIPSNSGLASKLQKLSKDYPTLDPVAVASVERLIQSESHADNLEDLVDMSTLSIEEVHQAALGVFLIIKEVDESHFLQMQKLCR